MPITKEHFIDILERISDGFISMDNKLVVNYFNKASEKMLGRKRGVLKTRHFLDLNETAKQAIAYHLI